MFTDDLQALKEVIRDCLRAQHDQIMDNEAKFSDERKFYMNCIEDDRKENERLGQVIEDLQKRLEVEQTVNSNLFVDEHVD
jgi:hypothetical protein